MCQIPIVCRRRHALPAVEACYVDLDPKVSAYNLRKSFESQQALSARDTQLDDRNRIYAKSLRQICRRKDAIGIVRPIENPVPNPCVDRADGKAFPQATS